MKKFVVIFFLLLMISCFKPRQSFKSGLRGFEPVDIDGFVFFEFLNQWEDYFFIKFTYFSINNGKTYFFDQMHYEVAQSCKIDTLASIYNKYMSNPKNDLSRYSQFVNQDIKTETDTANYYYGGDLYYTNTNEDIAIAFRLRGKGLKFNKICKAYLQKARYNGTDCPEIDKEDEFKVPFISLVEIDTIFSLSKEEQEKFNLTVCPSKYFRIGFCD